MYSLTILRAENRAALLFIAAFIAQWGIGAIINLWPTLPDGRFATEGYLAGFGMMLGLQMLGLVWFAISRRGSSGSG